MASSGSARRWGHDVCGVAAGLRLDSLPAPVQNFLVNSYPYSAWSTGAGRYITSVIDIGATADTCITPSGIAFVQQPNWASLSVAHVPRR